MRKDARRREQASRRSLKDEIARSPAADADAATPTPHAPDNAPSRPHHRRPPPRRRLGPPPVARPPANRRHLARHRRSLARRRRRLLRCRSRDGDGRLGRAEFAAALGALQPAQLRPTPPVVEASISSPPPPPPPLASLDVSVPQPEQCSIVLFYHLVKTAGTTMRNVLQRQAQLGEFEYVYTDTTTKPRWWLLMHQLSHRVAPRRIIIEVHSSGACRRPSTPTSAGCASCTSRLAVASRWAPSSAASVAWYFRSLRGARPIAPLCQWSPWYDGMARQFTGHSLPFVPAANPDAEDGLQPAAVSVSCASLTSSASASASESLLFPGARAGLRHSRDTSVRATTTSPSSRGSRASSRRSSATPPRACSMARSPRSRPPPPEYSSPRHRRRTNSKTTTPRQGGGGAQALVDGVCRAGQGQGRLQFRTRAAPRSTSAKGEWARETLRRRRPARACSQTCSMHGDRPASARGGARSTRIAAPAPAPGRGGCATSSPLACASEAAALPPRSGVSTPRPRRQRQGPQLEAGGTKLCGEPLARVGCTQDAARRSRRAGPRGGPVHAREQQLWCRRSWDAPGVRRPRARDAQLPVARAPIARAGRRAGSRW